MSTEYHWVSTEQWVSTEYRIDTINEQPLCGLELHFSIDSRDGFFQDLETGKGAACGRESLGWVGCVWW